VQNNSSDTPVLTPPSNDNDVGLFELITALGEVDITIPTAKENELTYSDNNGGRILL
jgi:hypothetical protein